jgi:hypothetical protein
MDVLARARAYRPRYYDPGDLADLIPELAAEITRLRTENVRASLSAAGSEILLLQVEVNRLRKALVHAVRTGYEIGGGGTYLYPGETLGPPTRFDGTDESLIATLCRLAQEGE